MQFQVPQFIETEDKIVGPLTLKQFIYIAVSVVISFILYFTTFPAFWFIASIFVVGGGLALAFLKINGQSLPKIISRAFRFYWSPQTYVWQPENPNLPKTESNMEKVASGFDLGSIIAGLALKHKWQNVQTGSKPPPEEAKGKGWQVNFPKLSMPKWSLEQYQIYQRQTGERRAARRIDYR